jgi:hypothetical protein
MEIWKPSPLAPAHVEVSNLGRVRTLDRLAPSSRDKQPTQLRAGKVLSPWMAKKTGYFLISVKEGDRRTKYLVHRLVASAFCTGFEPSLSVNHKDGDKTNNLPSNLEWVTLQRNTQHAWESGLVNLRGENQPTSKLTDDQVREIRARIAAGESCNSISKDYPVCPTIIYRIRDGEQWASVA